VWAMDGSVKAYNRGKTHFLEVDFNESFKGFIPIDLKRLEDGVKGLKDESRIYRVENIDNFYPDYISLLQNEKCIIQPMLSPLLISGKYASLPLTLGIC